MLEFLKQKRKNILTLFDQGLVSGSNFLLGVILAANLGVDAYGLYALLWMGLLFMLGLNQAYITMPLLSLAYKKDDLNAYIHLLYAVQWLAAIACTLLSMLSLFLFKATQTLYISNTVCLLLSGIIGLHLMYDFYRKHFFVRILPEHVLLSDFILYGGQVIIVFSLSFTDYFHLEGVYWILFIVHLIVNIMGWWHFKHLPIQYFDIRDVLKEHYQYAKWLVGTALLQWFSGNFFIIAAASLLGTSAVGAIRIVQNIMGLTHVLFQVMENITPIKAAQIYHQGGMKKLLHYIKRDTFKWGGLLLFILILLTFNSKLIISLLYGEAYLSYSYIVVGYCIIYLIVFLGYPLRFILRTLSYTKPIFIAYIFSTIFSLTAAYPLIKWNGLWGLLLGLFVTQVISQFTYCVFLRRRIKYRVN